MMITGSIVPVDQIDSRIREGNTPLVTIVDSIVCRVRPLSAAALATTLTLIVVPVLNVTLFQITFDSKEL